eukprot:4319948-Pyramimonas_sp.AAC.2
MMQASCLIVGDGMGSSSTTMTSPLLQDQFIVSTRPWLYPSPTHAHPRTARTRTPPRGTHTSSHSHIERTHTHTPHTFLRNAVTM